MTSAVERTILFLDVDGPLIPFGPSSGPPRNSMPGDEGNPLLTRLTPETGRRLTALDCHLVWASTWLDEANDTVAPRVGLPKLPVVTWPDVIADEGPRGLHWKTRHLVDWAAGRPFIWVDDEISDMDRLWVEAEHSGPSLLHRVDPSTGLLDADFTALVGWLDRLVDLLKAGDYEHAPRPSAKASGNGAPVLCHHVWCPQAVEHTGV
ncbi:HAD domain-containing protein [Streptomyces sp. Ru71]|uniref:HAD domain-containing protein n=1 Tax=Streptomyces sp. Ru71 TaxID=2080746 RepID=UPI0015E370C2|nr:HAD domain-containing protein [Streptomyces sp. Ru71]